jgi:hypothetical protein
MKCRLSEIRASGQTVEWTTPVLEPGETVTITINTRIRQNVAVPFNVTNTAVLSVNNREIQRTGASVISATTLPMTGESPWNSYRLPLLVVMMLFMVGLLVIVKRYFP